MMALLPLAGPGRARHARCMDAYSSTSVPGQRASWVVGFAHRVHHVFSEINQANKRAATLRLCYGLAESDRAPETYAEFLLRSKATLLHEPTARKRSAGRPVR